MKRILTVVAVAVFTIGRISLAYADSTEVMSMLESMKQQMVKMQQTIDQQNLRIQQLESQKALEIPQPNIPVQTQPTATSDADFQKGISDNIGKAVPWMKGLKYSGDFRLRYENFKYYDKNNDAGSTGTGADGTRNRFRIRLRWGIEKDFGDDWKTGFRLATGTATEPTGENVTLGSPGDFNFKTILIDRAYALYEPKSLKDQGLLKGVKVGAGKFENPFLRYSTSLVWDPDVAPEGAYEQANLQLVSTENTKVNGQVTLGQFIVNENNIQDSNAEIFGYQGTLNISSYLFKSDLPVDFTTAVSLYDYPNWSQTVLASQNTSAASYLRTNSTLAGGFRVLDIYPELVFYVNRMPVTLWYDYAKNLANDGTDNNPLTLGNEFYNQDTAFGFGAKIGKMKAKGAWDAYWSYFQIPADAVVAAFNDSDFGGPGTNGYTNRKGHKFGIGYKLTDNLALNYTGYLVAPFNSTTLVANSQNESVWRSQMDATYSF
ncbi:MAG: hypothetical protein AUJ72_02420 [Candidatus Omnitrophica bacterium CG1_02_46_14]|nr:MAG: hypothetical protein AUJ72_02420 [Candidatus Omnitrophica bacterium CG1_02_46_14]